VYVCVPSHLLLRHRSIPMITTSGINGCHLHVECIPGQQVQCFASMQQYEPVRAGRCKSPSCLDASHAQANYRQQVHAIVHAYMLMAKTSTDFISVAIRGPLPGSWNVLVYHDAFVLPIYASFVTHRNVPPCLLLITSGQNKYAGRCLLQVAPAKCLLFHCACLCCPSLPSWFA
jgi:hypothetical protein